MSLIPARWRRPTPPLTAPQPTDGTRSHTCRDRALFRQLAGEVAWKFTAEFVQWLHDRADRVVRDAGISLPAERDSPAEGES